MYTSVFDLYADNRRQGIGNYITPDLALLTYSLLRQSSIASMEQDILIPAYKEFLMLLADALSVSDGLSMAESGARGIDHNRSLPSANLVRQSNDQFIRLLRALMTNQILDSNDPVYEEQQRILKADSTAYSSLWEHQIDYTQFKPRGRYASSQSNEGYFRSLKYASSILFAVQPSAATGISASTSRRMVRQASQLIHLIGENARLSELRQQLEFAMNAQFGQGDDLSDHDWLSAERQIARQQTADRSGADIPSEQKGYSLLLYARTHQRQSLITAGLLDVQMLEPRLSIPDVLTGWRLMPMRYSAEAAFNQRLLFPQTGNVIHNESVGSVKADTTRVSVPFGLTTVNAQKVKGFPLGLESIAALGNQSALQQISQQGENRFEGYQQAFKEAQSLLGEAKGIDALHNKVVELGSHTIASRGESARLETLMSFQAWQRYLQLLYRKQTHTPTSKGIQWEQPRQNSDLEPASGLYLALAAASRLQHQITKLPAWLLLARHCERLAHLGKQRASGIHLTKASMQYLNTLDTSLFALVGEKDKPVVVDVHTEPNTSQVVQQGVGYPIIVRHNKLRGARMSFHEFKQPVEARLTDLDWQKRLSQLSRADES